MRKLIAALSLGCVLSVPAVATNWHSELDSFATRWAPRHAPQSIWHGHDEAVQFSGAMAGPVDPIRAFAYVGNGWTTLDGWMRRDPLLRQWIALRFDADGDRALSPGEAAMARQAFYTLADANRSGIITSEEFVEGWGTVRAAVFSPYATAG